MASTKLLSLLPLRLAPCFLLLFYLDLSICASIQLSSLSNHPLNFTSLSFPLNGTAGPYHCTRQSDFVTPKFKIDDCLGAQEVFAGEEERAHGHYDYEFISHGVDPSYPTLVSQITPRKYLYGQFEREFPPIDASYLICINQLTMSIESCVMAIVLMADPILQGVRIFGLNIH